MRLLLNWLSIILLSTWALPLQASGNQAEKFALVIGNGNYGGTSRDLGNAINDAGLIANSLQTLGFKVTRGNDLTRSQMYETVESFTRQLPEGSTAFVFYAGHGMQLSGSNYLLPVDIRPTSEQTTPLRAFSLKTLMDKLALSRSAVNIIVLDACRDNPFQPRSSIRYRSFGNLGLARMQAPRGTLLAFSTSPGQLAADGIDGHSIYTQTLAGKLLEPGLEIHELFAKVATTVRNRSQDEQIPWMETSLVDRYYFLPPEGVTVVAGKRMIAEESPLAGKRVRGSITEPAPTLLPWFLTLNTAEMNQIDWEVRQRAKRMTADELPGLEHKARGGSVVHQTVLGIAYREGVEKASNGSGSQIYRYKASNLKALAWLEKAANAGFPVAQVELGEMYYTGHGLDRDLLKSRHWLELAAQSGYARAKLDLLQLDIEAIR